MSGQLSLAGFEAQPSFPVFFAAYPDPAADERIAQLAGRLHGKLGLTGELQPPVRPHVTTLFLGYYEERPARLRSAARNAVADFASPCFGVSLDRLACFAENRALVLCGDDGVAGFLAVQRALDTAMRRVGVKSRGRPTPHLTLLYHDRIDPKRVERLAIGEPIRWTVREVVLVQSLVGDKTHVELAKWTLATPDSASRTV
jgi:2'-5' RNA ligase